MLYALHVLSQTIKSKMAAKMAENNEVCGSKEGVGLKQNRPHKVEKASKRRRKDPSAPKRPKSAYNFFFKEVRAIMAADDKLTGLSAMVGKVSAEWKQLTPEELVKYSILAKEDMTRYNQEMDSYHERPGIKLESETYYRKVRDISDPGINLMSTPTLSLSILPFQSSLVLRKGLCQVTTCIQERSTHD